MPKPNPRFVYSSEDTLEVVDAASLEAMGVKPVQATSGTGTVDKTTRASELLAKARAAKPKP